MQAAIDSAKRTFEVDITDEIQRLKEEINVAENKYPPFWTVIRRGFPKEKINFMLHSPMGYLYGLRATKIVPTTPTIPMSEFFVHHNLDIDKRISRKVEDWIEKYRLDVLRTHMSEEDEYLLLREDFEDMVYEIRQIGLGRKYLGMFSWLLDRGFVLTQSMKQNTKTLQSETNKNKMLLLNILYNVDKESFLACFR